MDTEAKIIIAFLFNRSGKTELKESELYLPLSLELRWFSTQESKDFIRYAIKKELLNEKEGLLKPNFPLEKIIIPLSFTPSKKKFTEKIEEVTQRNIIEEITNKIHLITNLSKNELLEKIKLKEKEKNLKAEVAALIIAKTYNVEIIEWYDSVENLIINGIKKV